MNATIGARSGDREESLVETENSSLPERLTPDTAGSRHATVPVVPDGWPPFHAREIFEALDPSDTVEIRSTNATDDPRWDERGLVARLRRNDPMAFATWVRRESPRLRAHARSILRNEEDAREAVQDGFLSAFKAIDRFDGRSSLSTWIHRIVVNAALMKRRWQQRRPEVALEEVAPDRTGERRFAPDSAETWTGTWDETAEDVALRRESRARVRAGIQNLPEPYRTVIVLRDLEGFDTRETAKRTGVSSDLVKVRLHRARHALRRHLEPELR